MNAEIIVVIATIALHRYGGGDFVAGKLHRLTDYLSIYTKNQLTGHLYNCPASNITPESNFKNILENVKSILEVLV